MVSPYLRTVKTSSGATAVQIVHSSHRGSRDIEHIGSAHDDVELELLKAAARQRLAAGQGVLDLGLDAGAPGGPLPGGGMEMNESLTDSVIREVKEETGYEVEVTGLVGTYTDPRHIIAYSDGEVRRQFNICFTAHVIGGQLAISDESTEIRFVDRGGLEELPMHPSQRLRLRHYLENRSCPFLG